MSKRMWCGAPLRRAAMVVAVLVAGSLAKAADERVLRHEIVVDRPVADVWRAWVTEEGLEQWMAKDARVDLRPGGVFATQMREGATVDDEGATRLRILTYEPEHILAYETGAPAQFPEVAAAEGKWAVISFDAVDEDSTRVRIAALGWQEGPQWDAAWEFFEKGNQMVLEQMKQALESPGWLTPPPPPEVDMLVIETDLPAPVERVYWQFTTTEGWMEAFVPVAEVDWRIGGTMKSNYNPQAKIGDPGTIVHHVLAYDPGHMLSSHFDVPENAAVLKPAEATWGVTTMVPIDEGRATRVRCSMIGWGSDEASQVARGHFNTGNRFVFEQLKSIYLKETDPETKRSHEEQLQEILDAVEGTAEPAPSSNP